MVANTDLKTLIVLFQDYFVTNKKRNISLYFEILKQEKEICT